MSISVAQLCVIVLYSCVIVLDCGFHKADLLDQMWFSYRCNKSIFDFVYHASAQPSGWYSEYIVFLSREVSPLSVRAKNESMSIVVRLEFLAVFWHWLLFLSEQNRICPVNERKKCNQLSTGFVKVSTQIFFHDMQNCQAVESLYIDDGSFYLKIIYKEFFKSFVALYADRICSEHHFVENRIENFPSF